MLWCKEDCLLASFHLHDFYVQEVMLIGAHYARVTGRCVMEMI